MMKIAEKTMKLSDGSVGNIRSEMATFKVNVGQQFIGHFLGGFEVFSKGSTGEDTPTGGDEIPPFVFGDSSVIHPCIPITR
jgi:hypothetical protein